MKSVFAILSLLMVSAVASAQSSFELEGVARDNDGKVIHGTFDITLRVARGSDTTCTLYKETHTGVQSDSLGFFTLVAGSQTHTGFPNIDEVISNSFQQTCFNASNISSGTFVPSSTEKREIHIAVTYNSTTYNVGSMTISPVPVAAEAARIGAHSSSSIMRVEDGAGAPVPKSAITSAQFDNLVPLYSTTSAHSNHVFAVTSSGAPKAKQLLQGTGVTITQDDNAITISSGAGSGTVQNVSVGGVPLSVGGSSTSPVISIAQANASQAGYLSASDYNTFSGKQVAGSYITALTGDVAATGPGSVGATIQSGAVNSAKILDGSIATIDLADKAVTLAKLNDVGTGVLLGRATAGTGAVELLTLGSNLTMTGGVLNTSGVGTVTSVGSTNAYLSVGSATTTPQLTLNVGTAANTVAAGNDSRITGALQKSGGTMTGAIDMGGQNLSSVGNVTMSASKSLQLGTFSADPSTAGWGTSEMGRTWFNTSSGQMKYWDGGAIRAVGASGASISSLGGQTGSSQSFASGSTGTAPTISSSGDTHTLNVPLASGSGVTSGTISKADYDAFAAKLSAITNIASLVSGKIWIGDGTGKAQENSLSGDVTMTNTGVTTIGKINGTTVSGVGLGTNGLLQNIGGSALTANNVLVTNATANGVTTIASPASGFLTSSANVPGWTSFSTDSFSQYAMLDGRGSGQTLKGGTANGGSLVLDSTSAGTKGVVSINPTGGDVKLIAAGGGNVGIGVTSPAFKLDVAGDVNITGSFKVNGADLALGGMGTINNLNGATGASQSFATATGNTAPTFTTNVGTGVHTLNIPMAGTASVTAGLISNSDYSVFAGKVSKAGDTMTGALTVNSVIIGKAPPSAVTNVTTTGVDFSTGNIQYTDAECSSGMILNHVKEGGVYTLIVNNDHTSVPSPLQCQFIVNQSGAGTQYGTIHYPPGHGAPPAGGYAYMYSFMVVGGRVYVTWVPGY